MSSKTTNLGLHKIDLNDAPPDITVLNQNWDTIDEELSNIGETVEEALGNLTPEKIGASPSNHTHSAEDIGALPIKGGTLTGTELGINNNMGKIFASGSVTRLYATDNPSDTTNQRYFNLYSQFFKEDISESLKVTERRNGVDTSYKIYGEHNITKSPTDIEAGTTPLADGHIRLVYE